MASGLATSHLYLVDGTFELFRCFKATPRAVNASGQEVGAIRGLLQTMVSLLKTDDLTHIAVAFDSVVSRVDRRDLSDSAMLRSQFALAAEAIRALGIVVWPMSRFQADEAIATGVRLFKDHVDNVTICSSDQDFCQCLEGDRVVLLNRITRSVQNEAAVVSRYGVTPGQFPEYLALVGDVSDGIPGIPGFGAKSAASLVSRYGNIEEILAHTADWSAQIRNGAHLADILAARADEALLYRNLSIRRDDVPLLDDIDLIRWQQIDHAGLSDLLNLIEDNSIVPRLERWSRYRSAQVT